MKIMWLPSLILLALITGCTSIGPSTITRDRFHYSSAIAESWKEMMLLNIVKLRYGDTPIFLEVGSVVSQYSLERELEAATVLNSGDLIGEGVSLGARGKYSDRPTITYSPLLGEKLAKSLLSPIPPHALFVLVQSGWNVDYLLHICLSAINGLKNSSERPLVGRAKDAEFEELLGLLAKIQSQGGLGTRLVEREGEKALLFFRKDINPEIRHYATRVEELLNLDPEAGEYRLIYGKSAVDGREIAMLTRSMLDIVAEFSQFIQIPEAHIRENRAAPGAFDGALAETETRSGILVRSAVEKPGDIYLAVRYRDHWFYIEDTDLNSKRVFSFLLFLHSLAQGGGRDLSPVLTLPAG